MSKEHFEPVTARSLASKIQDSYMPSKWLGLSYDEKVNHIEAIIAPHIRKPSDDDWMKSATFLLQKSITSYDNTKSVNTDEIRRFLNRGCVMADVEWVEENMREGKTSALEADIEWLTRGCMRIMHGKSDGDGQAYRELKDFISQKVSPTSAETKSVPQRCKEAYDEAVALLGLYNQKLEEDEPLQYHWKLLFDSVAKFLQKPNPFKEADIVKGEIPQSIARIAFDLELAKQGKKVVTKKGDNVKIVADDLTGNFPLLAVVTTGGVKFSCKYSIDGTTESQSLDMDLFILKEPETVCIDILRQEDGALYTCLHKDEDETYPVENGTDIIKTITVQI